MNEDVVLSLGNEALKVAFFIAGPLLMVAMVIGIVVSLIQAVTQINEATLTFIPKIVAISAMLVISGPWMLEKLTSYTIDVLTHLPDFIR